MKQPYPKPQRNTWQNFAKMVRSGQFIEILKVLRRRLINSARFVIRMGLRSLGIYYDSPWVRRRLLEKLLNKYYDWDRQYSDAPARIAIIARNGTTYPSSSTFVRLLSPLTDNSLPGKFFITLHPQNTADIDADICIVQRTAYDHMRHAKQLVENLRQKNAKLVLDTDDAFHAIGPSHPEHGLHSEKLQAFNYLADNADQIWVSTKRLGNFFKEHGSKVHVVFNSLDKRFWSYNRTRSDASGPLQLLYMGTGTHDADLTLIMPAFDQLAEKYPDSFQLKVVGISDSLPERDWLDRISTKWNGSIYPRFVPWFLQQGPFDIGLSPLVDNDFNRNKSDIKCLDYLAAGMLPVVSDTEPYKSVELDKFIVRIGNKSDSWQKKLSEFINDPEALRQEKAKILPNAQKYIWEERSSKTTAQKISKLLEQLTKNT